MNRRLYSPISFLGIVIWLLGALFFLYEFFLRTFIGSVAHQVIPALKLNAETFALLGSSYYFAYGIMQIPVGILSDKFGVKRIMIFATLTCAAATFLFSHATNFTEAMISRFLMGFGSSFAFICLLVIAMTWFPRKYFGFFAGLSQFIGTMGPFLAGGPLIAAMATFHQTWRDALITIGWIGIALSLLIMLIVRNKPRDAEQPLIYLRPAEPLKSTLQKLIKNKQVWVIALFSGSTYTSIALMGAVWGTEYLESLGLTQAAAAGMISLTWLGYAAGCPLFGALSDIAKRRKPALICCAMLGFFSTTGIVFLHTHHFWLFRLLFFTLGLAASGQNVGFATIAEQSSNATRASALGLNNGMITVFDTITPPIVSYFIYLSAGNNITHLKPHDFTYGLLIMPILYLIGITIAVFFIKETFCKPQKEVIMLTKNDPPTTQ